MGKDTEKKIAEQLTEIIAKAKEQNLFPISSGIVTAVDEDAMQITVLFSVNDDGNTSDEAQTTPFISLNVILNNSAGVFMVPDINAHCLIAEIDGSGQWELIKASKYSKVVVQADTLIQFNDGSKGGLTITPELKTQLDKNNSLLSHLITIINGTPIPEPGSGAASALQAALKTAIATDELGDFSNIENTAIKQG